MLKNYDCFYRKIHSKLPKILTTDEKDDWLRMKKSWIEIVQDKERRNILFKSSSLNANDGRGYSGHKKVEEVEEDNLRIMSSNNNRLDSIDSSKIIKTDSKVSIIEIGKNSLVKNSEILFENESEKENKGSITNNKSGKNTSNLNLIRNVKSNIIPNLKNSKNELLMNNYYNNNNEKVLNGEVEEKEKELEIRNNTSHFQFKTEENKEENKKYLNQLKNKNTKNTIKTYNSMRIKTEIDKEKEIGDGKGKYYTQESIQSMSINRKNRENREKERNSNLLNSSKSKNKQALRKLLTDFSNKNIQNIKKKEKEKEKVEIRFYYRRHSITKALKDSVHHKGNEEEEDGVNPTINKEEVENPNSKSNIKLKVSKLKEDLKMNSLFYKNLINEKNKQEDSYFKNINKYIFITKHNLKEKLFEEKDKKEEEVIERNNDENKDKVEANKELKESKENKGETHFTENLKLKEKEKEKIKYKLRISLPLEEDKNTININNKNELEIDGKAEEKEEKEALIHLDSVRKNANKSNNNTQKPNTENIPNLKLKNLLNKEETSIRSEYNNYEETEIEKYDDSPFSQIMKEIKTNDFRLESNLIEIRNIKKELIDIENKRGLETNNYSMIKNIIKREVEEDGLEIPQSSSSRNERINLSDEALKNALVNTDYTKKEKDSIEKEEEKYETIIEDSDETDEEECYIDFINSGGQKSLNKKKLQSKVSLKPVKQKQNLIYDNVNISEMKKITKSANILKLDEISSFKYYSKLNTMSKDFIYTSIQNSHTLTENYDLLAGILSTNLEKLKMSNFECKAKNNNQIKLKK